MALLRRLGTDEVSPIGLGGMYMSITGRPDEEQSLAVINAAIDSGVTLIDTADVYCLDQDDIGHNERLIAKALSLRGLRASGGPVKIATKGGLARPKGAWTRDARPDHLASACEASLRALGVETIDLYQLHAPDPSVPFADSVAAIARLRDAGKVRQVGLSNVSADQIEEALGICPIASVQNRYNPQHRSPEHDGVLAACEKHGLAFLPFSPFGGASGARGLASLGTLAKEAEKRNVSAHRLVLGWMLAKSPVAIPIPGARRVPSVLDSAAATSMMLLPEDIAAIERSFDASPRVA